MTNWRHYRSSTVRHLGLLDVAANVHLNPSLDRRLAEPSKSRNVQSAASIQCPVLSREQGGLWRTAHRAFDVWLWRYGVSARLMLNWRDILYGDFAEPLLRKPKFD